jgi:hypothetical protein
MHITNPLVRAPTEKREWLNSNASSPNLAKRPIKSEPTPG